MTKIKTNYSNLPLFAVLILATTFLIYGLRNHQVDLREPEMGKYTTDERIYLKSFYLVDRGMNHYQALPMAVDGEVSNIRLTNDIFTWRLPGVFIFWKYLANTGEDIKILFWLMASFMLFAIFLINRKITNSFIGLLGLFLAIPYLLSVTTYPTSIMFTEWWALFFFSYALACYLFGKDKLAWLFFASALAIRELIIIPITLAFVVNYRQSKQFKYFGSLVLFFLLFFTWHYLQVESHFIGSQTGLTNNSLSRLKFPSKNVLLPFLAFAMQLYPLIQIKIHYLIIGLSLILGLLNLKIHQTLNSKFMSANIMMISPILVFPFIITSKDTNYWSILAIPLLISTMPSWTFNLFLEFIKTFRVSKSTQ